MITFEIIKEPKNNTYIKLIEYLAMNSAQFILVKRNQLEYNDNANSMLEKLKPFIVKIMEVNEWPGTKLLGSFAKVFYFYCNIESQKILANSVKSLYSWISPNFPEDLCFLKDESTAWFVSISHENDSYFIGDYLNTMKLWSIGVRWRTAHNKS